MRLLRQVPSRPQEALVDDSRHPEHLAGHELGRFVVRSEVKRRQIVWVVPLDEVAVLATDPEAVGETAHEADQLADGDLFG